MKLWAFGIAAGIAGASGVLATFRQPTVLFENRSVLSNIQTIGFAVVGGVGSVLGAGFGSLLEPAGAGNQLLGSVVGAGPVVMGLIGGLLLVLTIIVSPDGIALQMLDDLSRFRRGVAERRAERWMNRFAADVDGDDRPTTEPKALVATGLAVTFGTVRAVDEVDLTVEPGEIVGVVGANGAGKTTLIDSLTGFAPAEGTIRMGDVDLSRSPAHLRARHGLCRSWQSLELIEDLTVLENLRAGAESGGRWSPMVHLIAPGVGRPDAHLVRLVDSLDLRSLLGRMPGELSTGQRKRVALARAIASRPSILLLDEPCSGLDTDERNEVASLVEMLAREWGIGVLLVEHDVHLVRRLADRVMALDFGSVVAQGDPDAVLADERVMAAFLGETPDDTAAVSGDDAQQPGSASVTA
jgi:sulfate-transporting ATPase